MLENLLRSDLIINGQNLFLQHNRTNSSLHLVTVLDQIWLTKSLYLNGLPLDIPPLKAWSIPHLFYRAESFFTTISETHIPAKIEQLSKHRYCEFLSSFYTMDCCLSESLCSDTIKEISSPWQSAITTCERTEPQMIVTRFSHLMALGHLIYSIHNSMSGIVVLVWVGFTPHGQFIIWNPVLGKRTWSLNEILKFEHAIFGGTVKLQYFVVCTRTIKRT